jgi:hypothetical protein
MNFVRGLSAKVRVLTAADISHLIEPTDDDAPLP